MPRGRRQHPRRRQTTAGSPTRVDPEFSEKARQAKFSGNGEVSLKVDATGATHDLWIIRAVGMDTRCQGRRSGQPVQVRPRNLPRNPDSGCALHRGQLPDLLARSAVKKSENPHPYKCRLSQACHSASQARTYIFETAAMAASSRPRPTGRMMAKCDGMPSAPTQRYTWVLPLLFRCRAASV